MFCVLPFDLLCLHFDFSSIYRLNRIARVRSRCSWHRNPLSINTSVTFSACSHLFPDWVLLRFQRPAGERHGQSLHLEVRDCEATWKRWRTLSMCLTAVCFALTEWLAPLATCSTCSTSTPVRISWLPCTRAWAPPPGCMMAKARRTLSVCWF